MKDYFTSETPTNYTNVDVRKDYYFKDYKHLKNVDWEEEKEETTILKVSGGLAFIIVLFFLMAIA